ncbi:MAG: NDP-sugar synthase, partial [Candidatus Nanoarchaeia archaeon]|nr:NDP-sugar synthase [Candidatus Jingweiarchaeum tengchongense]
IKYQPNLNDVGSADSLRLNLNYYNINAPILCVQGDNVFDIDLVDLINEHEKKDAFMTIVLTKVDRTEEYGIADMDSNRRIRKFVEKPRTEEAPSRWANTGIYLISPDIKDVLESKEVKEIKKARNRLDFGLDFIPHIVDHNFPVYGYEMKKRWYDVGTPEGYLKAMREILNGALDMRIKEERIFPGRNVWVQGFSRESVKLREKIIKECKEGRLIINGSALIGRHCRIGDGTKITDSNIDNYCIIGRNVQVENAAIMDSSSVGDSSKIKESIIGRNVVIESSDKKPTEIDKVSVIGNDVKIGEGCRIISTRIYPSLCIPPNSTYINKVLISKEDVERAKN